MVGAGLPEHVAAAHAVEADQRVLDRVVERVAHVQAAGDVGRRQHDAVGPRARVGDRREVAALLPRRRCGPRPRRAGRSCRASPKLILGSCTKGSARRAPGPGYRRIPVDRQGEGAGRRRIRATGGRGPRRVAVATIRCLPIPRTQGAVRRLVSASCRTSVSPRSLFPTLWRYPQRDLSCAKQRKGRATRLWAAQLSATIRDRGGHKIPGTASICRNR